ncbi:MAG: hypothetical protein ABW049_01735 [Spongiibacteraceae bacterium]
MTLLLPTLTRRLLLQGAMAGAALSVFTKVWAGSAKTPVVETKPSVTINRSQRKH